jgi:predicted transposase YbfD/YdcC
MPPTPGWESVVQCFVITRSRTDKKRGLTTTETVCGITSLPRERADAKRLLKLNREHWQQENLLHWVRDTLFKEDASTLRNRTSQAINAACNSLAIFLLKQEGCKSLTEALEACADNKAIPIGILEKL